VSLLFLPSDQALAAEQVSDCSLLFYVISGKVLVKMSLVGCGGRTARFALNKGGAWEVPRGATYSLKNGLAMTAQLIFWRWSADAEGMCLRGPLGAGCDARKAAEGMTA
jgi:glyoxylate utilization-related uncharacterized protein